MFSWYRVSSSFSHFPLSNPEKHDIQCPKFSNFVPFTPVTRHSLLPPKENKDLRSSESKLSPSRLVCEGASGQASTFNRNSPRNRALCSFSPSLPSHVECSFTREVVGVPGNFEQRLVLGHDKPPSGARRAPSLLWRLQRNLPDEKPAHYLYPPRSSTRYYRGERRREGERPSSLSPLRCLLFGSSTCTRELAGLARKPGNEPTSSGTASRAKPVVDQRNRCRSIPPSPSPSPLAAISPISSVTWPRRRRIYRSKASSCLIFVS